MAETNDAENFSVEKIMRMIKQERLSQRKKQKDTPSTRDKTSKIAPYEEALRIKSQNFINQNWHINIHTDGLPFSIDGSHDEQKDNLDYLNLHHTIPFDAPFKSRSKLLGLIVNPVKKIIRKVMLSSIGELFTRQEKFNSRLVRYLNRQQELMNQMIDIVNQLNVIIARQREMNLNIVSFCNQVNFREDVLTIKNQHTEEMIRELYRRMDNLYVVSNLAYILEEKVNKLQEELKKEHESFKQSLTRSSEQA